MDRDETRNDPARGSPAHRDSFEKDIRVDREWETTLSDVLSQRDALRSVMDIMPVGMALVAPDGRVVEVNRANASIWRTDEHPKPGSLNGYDVFKGWDPDTRRPYAAGDWPVGHVMRTGEAVIERVVEIERFDGVRRYAEITALPVRGADGTLRHIVVFTSDVTEREKRQRLSVALDDINMAIHATLDADEIVRVSLTKAIDAYAADRATLIRLESTGWQPFRTADARESTAASFIHETWPFADRVAATRQPLLIGKMDRPHKGFAAANGDDGTRALVAIPLMVLDQPVSVIQVEFGSEREFTASDEDFARKLGGTTSFALDNAHLYEQLSRSLASTAEKDRAIRQAYSDVIEAVTGGRLILLGQDELELAMLPIAEAPLAIEAASELHAARAAVKFRLTGIEDADDLVIAFGEAATNALKHAGGGRFTVARSDWLAQVVVTDGGQGIDFAQLPKATLVPGFSTKQSLGVGFTLMMELTDRVLLHTSTEGTTVVLERDLR